MEYEKNKCTFRVSFIVNFVANTSNATKLECLIICSNSLLSATSTMNDLYRRLLAIFHFNEICHFNKSLHTIHIYTGLNLGTC